jgi:hypothetical protein
MHIYETTNTNCELNCELKGGFLGIIWKIITFEVKFEKALFYKFALCSTTLTIENTGKA